MTSVPHSHLPYGEPGCGTFGQWLGQQYYAYIASVLDQILDAVGKLRVFLRPLDCLSPRLDVLCLGFGTLFTT